MSTAALLARMGSTLATLGASIKPGDQATVQAQKALTPTVPTTGDLATANFMNQPQVEALVDMTVSQSAWLSNVSVKLRQQRSGTMPRLVINDVVTEGVDENAGATVATSPDTSEVSYNCGKFQATWYLTLEDVSEARAAGEGDFDGKVRRAFAKAMGNDMARWFLNGDTTLDASSRLNKLLRKQDGILVQARSDANYLQTTYGSSWARNVYPAMKRAMPTQFKDDPGLRWFMPPDLDEDVVYDFQQLGDGAKLRDEALTQRKRYSPMGISPLLVPQWGTAQGFDTLSGSTSNADGVTDNTTTISFQVDALFGGYSASHDGRQVKVTYDSNGSYEIATVVDSGSQLDITTTGTLGQSTVSTTAGDYTLDLADCTGQILTNPRNLFLVLCRNIRAYRKFEQEAERWRIDVYYEGDAGIYQPDAMVLQEGIVPTDISFGA